MRKKLIALLLVVALSIVPLSGCSAKFSKVKQKADFKQEYDYVVRSNGGNAVQYGEFVYFINGTRGYDDTDAKQNVFGKVVKGALYKAKLNGAKNGREFDIIKNASTGLEFFTQKGIDYTDEETEIDEVVVDIVAPKVIGTSGYSDGGVFIFDEYVYYATPKNTKDKTGTVETTKTDFMRTKLDGTSTQLIFSTESDSASLPYGFYKYGDSVYLVCYYGTTIVSVRMKEGKTKIEKAMVITDKATSVIFPKKDVYDKTNNVTNDPEDFIYWTRAIEAEDMERAGNVVELSRVDGSENFSAFMTGKNITLLSVNSGGLFYKTTVLGNETIKFDNLHEALMLNSPSYKAYEDTKEADTDDMQKRARAQVSEDVFAGAGLASYTTTYCFRDNLFTNICYIIGITGTETWLLSNYGDSIRILKQSVNFQLINNNYLYYTSTDDSIIYRTDYTLSDTAKSEPEKISKDATVSSGLKADIAAGHIFYFSRVDEWADGYGFFKDLKLEGSEQFAVYQRNDTDVKPEEDEE